MQHSHKRAGQPKGIFIFMASGGRVNDFYGPQKRKTVVKTTRRREMAHQSYEKKNCVFMVSYRFVVSLFAHHQSDARAARSSSGELGPLADDHNNIRSTFQDIFGMTHVLIWWERVFFLNRGRHIHHHIEGDRYNTARKRERERLYWYCNVQICSTGLDSHPCRSKASKQRPSSLQSFARLC